MANTTLVKELRTYAKALAKQDSSFTDNRAASLMERAADKIEELSTALDMSEERETDMRHRAIEIAADLTDTRERGIQSRLEVERLQRALADCQSETSPLVDRARKANSR